jgi:hypothetical protein
MEPTKVEYDLTKEDYIAFNMHHIDHSPTIKRSLFIQRYIVALIFLAFPFIYSRVSGAALLLPLIVYGVVFIIWILYYPRYFTASMKKRILKMINEGSNASLFGPRSITLNESGVTETSENDESRSSWRSIEKIDETAEHIYIYISSINAYLVPVRAFEDRTKKEAFLERLKDKKYSPTKGDYFLSYQC